MSISVNHDSQVKDINFSGGGGIGDITISSSNDANNNMDRINNPISVGQSSGPNLSISDGAGPGGGDMFGMDLLSNKNNDKSSGGGGYDSGHESDRSYSGSERSVMSDRSHQSQSYNKEKYDFIHNYNDINNEKSINVSVNDSIKDGVNEMNSMGKPMPGGMGDGMGGGQPMNPMDPMDVSSMEPPPANAPPVDDDLKPIHLMSSFEIRNEKIDYIYKFKKLEKIGIRTSQQYSMNSNLEEMRNEYLRLKRGREVDNSIKFQRKMLMACVTGIEFLNTKFDPFDVKLDGWSESVNDNVNDYDEIFEELYDKYNTKTKVAPELKLMFALGGSAFMFHLTNTMFKTSLPGMDDIMKQNPDLMKQFASAAMNSVSQPPGAAPMGAGTGAGSGMQMPGMFGMPAFSGGGATAPSQQSPPTRPEMSGPSQSNLDHIISGLNTGNLPDVDNISIRSGSDMGGGETRGISLNL
jgi:hypothetical protein